MRFLRPALPLLLLASTNECGIIQAQKLAAPESFGLVQITPSIFVEDGASDATRTELRHAMDQVESAISQKLKQSVAILPEH